MLGHPAYMLMSPVEEADVYNEKSFLFCFFYQLWQFKGNKIAYYYQIEINLKQECKFIKSFN